MPRFSPDFIDELRSRLRASDIIGRHVKLKKEGREWRGLSPFTSEKTPSFFVNDEKARYFDFSSDKSGDIVGFMMDVQKLSFVEAVSRLAEEAGMEIPKDSAAEELRAEKAKGLIEAHEAAAHFFQQMLLRADGRAAFEYLRGRAVSDALIKQFGLGYAPDNKTALKDYLINKGFSVDVLVESGLLIQLDDGPKKGETYDRFRGRVMFPIFNSKGQPIAFGGRALDKNAKAKYLNSPDTPLFHKGNVLYNLGTARKFAAGMENKADSALIVCEGYMDVIALAGAGFGQAVAPLGTALTENHLSLLWRVSDEPLLCFDGDRAGRSAAHRSIDRALPLLKPGKSLRFVFMPEGKDPDDLIRGSGAGAFREALNEARPMVEVLWEREVETQPIETPERRALFRQELRRLVQTIADKDVRDAYGGWVAEKLANVFPGRAAQNQRQPWGSGASRKTQQNQAYQPWRRGSNPFSAPIMPSPALKARLGSGAKRSIADESKGSLRERLLTLTLVNHPGLFAQHEADIIDLNLKDAGLSRLLARLIDGLTSEPSLDFEGLKRHISSDSACAGILESLLTDERLKIERFARHTSELAEAETGWRNTLSLHLYHGLLKEEAAEAASEVTRDETGEARWRELQLYRHSVVADGKDSEIDGAPTAGKDHKATERKETKRNDQTPSLPPAARSN